MTQTATFPNLESIPNVSTQAILYFSSSLGTLSEVDVVASGSFSTEFFAENLGPSSNTITGVTTGNLAINGPSGAIPISIPSVTERFNAAPFDGTVGDAGPSGKDFAPVTSSSLPHTTVLTSSADLAAFTGNFRIPITVSGHATGNASATNGSLSAGFKTQTSVTLTVIYHYTPNLPSLDSPPADSPAPAQPVTSSPAPVTSPAPVVTTPPTSPAVSTPVVIAPTRHATKAVAKKKVHVLVKHAVPKVVHLRPKVVVHMKSARAHGKA
jgi:hypothetical protein